MALAAIIIAVASFGWTVMWSVHLYRQQNRRDIRVRAWFGMTIGPPGREGIDTISVSAVNAGHTAVTLRLANARIVGDRQLAIRDWLHQQPTALGRAMLGRGEYWEGLVDAGAFAASVERAASIPPPWQVVFAVIDADENRFEMAEEDALEFGSAERG